MKLGKYNIRVTRTTDVQITIADLELFNQDYQAWQNMYGDSACDVTEEDFLASRAIMSVAGGTSEKYNNGLTIIHKYSDQDIEHIRTCRHCGCTEYEACSLSTGPCSWLDEDLCSNPFCIASRQAEQEKEVTHG